MANSFGSQATLRIGAQGFTIHRLDAVARKHPQAGRLPFSLKILLENLLRTEDGLAVRPGDIEALANWDPKARPDKEIAFTPARVLMQDFTGVPAIVDLAAMRDAMRHMGGDPKRINPLLPAELVIDHSVQVDDFGSGLAFRTNADMEYTRNRERYAFLRWGQKAFQQLHRRSAGDRHRATRSIWNTWPAWSSLMTRRNRTPWPTPIPWWAPIRTRP